MLALVAGLAACGSSNSATPTTIANPSTTVASTTALPHGSGAVNVLYAGSLVNLMEKQVGPAFHQATGYTVTGFSGGSDALVSQIKGKVHAGDVFISASTAPNAELTGASNGDWVSWYATFATAPLVIGYNPNSHFAADIKSKPWYQVITEPGFRLGRTDPKTDPKGKLTATALATAAKAQNLPALTTIANSTSNVFPEETLVGRLQAGQLDAGFFYSSEATAANIPTVPVTGQSLKATYTVTVLNHAPNSSGAQAFVQYLLGSQGQATLKKDGFDLITPPKVTGTGVPAPIQGVISGS